MTSQRPRDAGGRFVAPATGARRKKRSKITADQRRDEGEGPVNKHWRTYFLQKLAETSNVKASAMYAEIAASRAYKARREEADFAADWRAALHEGYDNLEMELLGHLRAPAAHGAAGHKMDVTAALRLLVAHRETVARERALREDDDEQEVLDSIDRFIDQMRERRAANAAILAEQESDETEHGDGAD